MGAEIRARLRRNAREPYTWLLTVMAVLAIALDNTGHKHMGLVVLMLQVATFAVDRWTLPADRSQQ